MSPFAKVKMSPSEGTRNGQTTRDERQRIEPVRSDAEIIQKTDEPKRSRSDLGLKYPPDQTLVAGLSPTGCGGISVQAPGTQSQQSFSGEREETSVELTENEISRLWTNAGA